MKSLFICFTFYLLVACAHVNAICEPLGVRGNFWRPILSFHHVDPRGGTQVLILGDRFLSQEPFAWHTE